MKSLYAYALMGIMSAAMLSPARASLPKPAAEAPGRGATNITIQIEEHGKYSRRYPAAPYVDKDGCVNLLPGDELIIEFDVQADGSLKPKRVEKLTTGKEAITVKFTNDGERTILITENNCSRILTMKCRHGEAGRQKLFITGLNPREPGMYSYDSWPAVVVSLKLFDFRFWDDYDKAFDHER